VIEAWERGRSPARFSRWNNNVHRGAKAPAIGSTAIHSQSTVDGRDERRREHAQDERARIERKENEVTVDSDESFPASDPPSFNLGTTGGHDGKKKKKI